MLEKQKYLEKKKWRNRNILKKRNVDEIEIFKRNGNGEIEILKKPTLLLEKQKCYKKPRNV